MFKNAFLFGIAATAVGFWGNDAYTLYRSSVLDEHARIHVATFDADGGDDYNGGNCRLAAELLQKQDGVKTRFWCEKGTYRK